MVKFKTTILKFGEKGEKTGWTYIEVSSEIAQKLMPGNKKSFRVKGKLDTHPIKQVALIPMGEGDFVLPLNGAMRKAIGKGKGHELTVQLVVDESPILLSSDLVQCLDDEPRALNFFNKLPKSHQNYYSKWIESAKTEPTKTKRIAQTIKAMSMNLSFSEMMRALKKEKENGG